jgi:hypothetical protein
MKHCPISELISGQGLYQRAAADGVSEFGVIERVWLIVATFFTEANKSSFPQGETIIDELIWRLAELISMRDPVAIRSVIRTIFSELEFVRDGFRKGKRPRRARNISANTIRALSFQLPPALMPPAWAGLDFGDFGNVVGQTEAIHDAERPNTLLFTSSQSLLLSGLLHVAEAFDRKVTFGTIAKDNAPTWFHILAKAQNFNQDAGIRADVIRDLDADDLKQLTQRAANAIDWLRVLFSIRSKTDPLTFGHWQFLMPSATTVILNEVCDLFAPWPDYASAVSLPATLTRSAAKHNDNRHHADLDQDLYWHIFAAVRHLSLERGVKAKDFKERARLIGLFDPESDAFGRFQMNFTAIFRQVRELHRVRCHIAEVLKQHKIEPGPLGGSAPLPKNDSIEVKWTDYDMLGLWSSYLKGLLKLGLVERRREDVIRLRLPDLPRWTFPSIPVGSSLETMTRWILEASRAAQRVSLEERRPKQ